MGLPYRVLSISHKKELLKGLWVFMAACLPAEKQAEAPKRAGDLATFQDFGKKYQADEKQERLAAFKENYERLGQLVAACNL